VSFRTGRGPPRRSPAGTSRGRAFGDGSCREGATGRSSSYYFRTTPRFETGNPKYAFINGLLAVASGDRKPGGPIYTIYEIL